MAYAKPTDCHYGIIYANGGIWVSCTGTGAINLNKLSNNQYNTIAFVYTQSQCSCYINGEYLSNGSPWNVDSDTKLYIGKGPNGFNYTQGYFRNIAVYDTALTESEIQNFEFDY